MGDRRGEDTRGQAGCFGLVVPQCRSAGAEEEGQVSRSS